MSSFCAECNRLLGTGQTGFCQPCRADVGRMMKRLVLQLRDDERLRISRSKGWVSVRVAARQIRVVEAYVLEQDLHVAIVRCVEGLEHYRERR